MNKVFMMLIALSVPWLGGCATMFSEGRHGRYPLEIKAKDEQKAFFHVAGLGPNASIQITGQAPKKLYLPLGYSGEAATRPSRVPQASYRVSCKNADGKETRIYKIREGPNTFTLLNIAIPIVGFVGIIVDLATGAALDLSPEEVVC